MLTRKPKRTELLPLFLGQPPAMTVFMLVVALVLSVLVGVCHFAWNLFHPGGTATFLPTQDVVIAAVCFGIALGVFNIAGDSAEMDTVLERRTLSVATYLLVDLSLTFVESALHVLVSDTYVTQYVGAFELSMLGTLLVAIVEVRVLQWHFRNCLKDADAMHQHLVTQT
jgi:hypothetical protein